MYRKPRRDSNERKIITFLERCGAGVVQLDDPSVPDLLVSWKGYNLLCEVKSKSGTLTPAQKKFFKSWQGQKTVVRSITDVKCLLRTVVMPLYIYKCTACNKETTIIHSMFEEPHKICPDCGQATLVRLIMSAPTIIYKGNGWAGKDGK